MELLKAVAVSEIEIVPMRWREKVGSAKTLLGKNQLTPLEVTCDQRTLPTRGSHYICHKQRRCSKFLSIGTLLLLET